MGNSRVLFIAAISAMLGMYSLGIKKADQKAVTIPISRAYKMQAKEISKGGVGMALNGLLHSRRWQVYDRARGKPMLNGQVDYYVMNYSSYGWNYAYIQSTGTFKGQTVTTSVWAEQVKKNKWKIVRQYTQTSNSTSGYEGFGVQ
jgi:hypothetical protein